MRAVTCCAAKASRTVIYCAPSLGVHNSQDTGGLVASVGVSFRTVFLIFTQLKLLDNLKGITDNLVVCN